LLHDQNALILYKKITVAGGTGVVQRIAP